MTTMTDNKALASKYAAVADQAAALSPSWEQTMIRVRDPTVSIKFYEENFGMTLLHELHFGPDQGDFSVFFLATLSEQDKEQALPSPGTPEAIKTVFDARKGQAHLELTWNHGSEKLAASELPLRDHAERAQLYTDGNADPRGFGHIAFNCTDVYAASAALEAKGVAFKKRPDEGRMKGLAFCLDPDGYWIELVKGEREQAPERFNLSQTMLRIKDPSASVPFYRSLFAMDLVSERHFGPEQGDFSLYFLATRSEQLNALLDDDQATASVTKTMWDPALELTHNHGTENEEGPVYHNGNDTTFPGFEEGKCPRGFGHIGFLVDDLDQFCALLEQVDVTFIKRPQDGRMRGIAFAKDPTGYWIEIIQRGVTF